jgi:hypothetical protein
MHATDVYGYYDIKKVARVCCSSCECRDQLHNMYRHEFSLESMTACRIVVHYNGVEGHCYDFAKG